MIGKTIFGLSAVALAAAAASASPPSATGAGKDANKMICRTIQEIGSRLNKTRACHTKAEWEDLRRQARQNVQNIQDRRPANLSN
jgi:Spy/CpxP family protein refolding chaperone